MMNELFTLVRAANKEYSAVIERDHTKIEEARAYDRCDMLMNLIEEEGLFGEYMYWSNRQALIEAGIIVP